MVFLVFPMFFVSTLHGTDEPPTPLGLWASAPRGCCAAAARSRAARPWASPGDDGWIFHWGYGLIMDIHWSLSIPTHNDMININIHYWGYYTIGDMILIMMLGMLMYWYINNHMVPFYHMDNVITGDHGIISWLKMVDNDG